MELSKSALHQLLRKQEIALFSAVSLLIQQSGSRDAITVQDDGINDGGRKPG
jgi:hypothetical protein